MNNQLYRLHKNLSIPSLESCDLGSGEILENKKCLKGYYSFKWPNGSPCLLAEMYLLDKSAVVSFNPKDGGTLGNYARNLSHIVRYCFSIGVDFCDLHHKDVDAFVSELCQEVSACNERVRNNNTVKSIVATTIDFLVWVQKNVKTDRLIIGVDDPINRHQIKLVSQSFKTKSGGVVTRNVFPSQIPRSTTEPVNPISSKNIKLLWDALEAMKGSYAVSKKLQAAFDRRQQKDHLEYMHKRRELQLILLESTGLRPQELITIPCKENLEHLKKSQLIIPTLKRRSCSKLNMRTIPIPRGHAMRVEIFINLHRRKLVERLVGAGLLESFDCAGDALYLNSETGREVMPDAAYQDFRRLTVRAGIKQKNCQKMFRHRFITNMVKLHLIGFMDKNPLKSRQMVTESDYRTILKKVASFTGHKSVDSLMHYIDLAWEEVDAFSYTYEVKALQDQLRSIYYAVSEIKGDINALAGRRMSASVIDGLLSKVAEVEGLIDMA